MNAAELDALLRQFLVDQKLNENERKVLANWVGENVQTEQQRGVARSRLFAAARNAVADPNGQLVVGFLEDALKVLLPMGGATAAPTAHAFFSPGDACLNRIISRVNGARNSMDICVFTITDDRISNPILAAHRRGVKIRILSDNDKMHDEGSDIPRFLDAKIPLRIDHSPSHMHHKFAIFDGKALVNGSYNWTRSAAEMNQENIIDSENPQLVAQFQAEFENLWTRLV